MSKNETESRSTPKQFASWRSYWSFRREVTRGYRYLRSAEAQDFLNTLAVSSQARAVNVSEGKQFFRSQVAHHERWDEDAGEHLPSPALPERMKPFVDRASEGRVNPKGIPCLYLASDEHTAIAESRPWIGSLVSVGRFRTTRNLRIVDCGKDADHMPMYFGMKEEPPPAERSEAVWAHIARAFREPVTRNDDIADYASTQVVAEVFRTNGFDGVAYRSAFGTDCYNIAIFDVDAAELCMCTLHEIKDVKLDCPQCDNPYYVEKNQDGSTSLVRNVIVGVYPLDQK